MRDLHAEDDERRPTTSEKKTYRSARAGRVPRRKARASGISRILTLGELEGGVSATRGAKDEETNRASSSQSGTLLLPSRPHAIAKGERADEFRNPTTSATVRPPRARLTAARSITPAKICRLSALVEHPRACRNRFPTDNGLRRTPTSAGPERYPCHLSPRLSRRRLGRRCM